MHPLDSLAEFPREDVPSAAHWLLDRACQSLDRAGAAYWQPGPDGVPRLLAATGTLADAPPAPSKPPAGVVAHPIRAPRALGTLLLDERGASEWTATQAAWWEAFLPWFALAVETAELHRLVSRSKWDAAHDPLTTLPNRAYVRAELALVIDSVRRNGGRVALLLLDLDHFKEVNDALGHEAGDHLLRSVARWLLEAVRDGDTVARMGGDEFVVLMRDAGQRVEVALLARRLCETVANGQEAIDASVRVTASIGIALCPDHGDDVVSLLRHADLAMYDAKKAGRDTFRFWNPRQSAPAPGRIALESRLREAIDRRQLGLVYQPQARLTDGAIAGLEALLRIDHPKLGAVPPEAVMAVAETSYVMGELSAWGLLEACRQARAWRDAGLLDGWIAVNMPPAAVQHARFPNWVADALEASGLPADALVIELTERSVVRNIPFAVEMLSRLGDLGVRIGIDDFGVGHSALGYLNRLPVHKIKLDRSFVEGLPTDADSAAIVRNLIRMASDLDLTVLAEGVETAEQAEWLRAAGCDYAQGYWIARPMRPEQAEAFLRERAQPSLDGPARSGPGPTDMRGD